MINKKTAYVLWLLWLMGLGGIHRIYAGQVIAGLIYLFTWGLFGVGQLVDLVLIPGMVDEQNLKHLALRGGNLANQAPQSQTIVINVGERTQGETSNPVVLQLQPEQALATANPQADTIKLLKLAQRQGGTISLADAVIELGKPTADVRSVLASICSDQLMETTNHESTGAVIYRLL